MRRSLRAIHWLAMVGVLSRFSLCPVVATGDEPVPVQTSKPSVEGPEGAQAFVDLATYYQDHQKPPPVDRVLQELDSVDQAARASSGKYILALLAQSQADETNGRGGWQRSGLPAWGSDPESDARAFRESLAEKLAGGTTATEALDAAVWLLKEDNLADDQKHGVTLLCRIKSRRVEDLFQELLRQPHPNQSVLVAVLEQVAERKLVEPAPEVRRLAIHYREAVRAAAHKAAKALEISDVAEYQPEKAFTPWLDGLLKDIAAMIEGGVPEGAKWSDFTVTYPPSQTGGEPFAWSTSGWLLSEDNDKVQVLSWLGSRYELPKTRTKVEPSTLAKAGRTLLRIRKEATGAVSDANQEVLSPSGSLSAQFEPAFINLPEGLVAAWLHERGDKRLTAELLFPRIEAAEDDRWIGWATRDMLGNVYHREMLDTFANDRDYESTIRLAKHLSKTVFDGYPYQQRAKKLAAQLANRGDDFKAFRLPTPDEWQQLTMKLDRAQQIEYLAARLRLLNCFQWGQPGGVDYGDPQTAKPGRQLAKDQMRERWSNPYGKHPSQVVNPFVELREMNIQVADLSALVPFLADENFMPTYSYWRDFHPDRTLHQVNWAVAEIVNGVAKHDLAQLSEFLPLDEQGRQRHIDSILEWCRQHAGKSGNELLLQSLAEAKRWREFKWAADEAAEKRLTDALPIFVRRFTDFDHCQDDIAELCYLVDSADAVAPAHKWSTSEDESVRFWSALILLRHGDQTKPEGLAELEPILAKDDGSLRYPHAIEPLLATKNEKAVTLAYGILRKDGFRCSDVSSSPILERLFLAGRQEGLDYMLAHLESEEPSGSAIGVRDGKEVQRSLVEGDRAAIIATSWQTGDKTFDAFSPDDARRSQRKQLRGWLETQYALIQAGKKPEMTILPVRLRMAQAQFDAP